MTTMGPYGPHAPDGVHLRDLTVADVDLLEPLWRALLDGIRAADTVVPIVPHEESWPMRQAEYEDLLSRGKSFGLVALRGDEPIGYAVVRVEDGPDPVWRTGGRYVELTSLSVAPAERDRGIGTRLLDEVEEWLSDLEVDGFVIGVDAVNDAALRFYERRGFRVGYHLLYGRLGHPAAVTEPTDDESPETASHGEV
ncbi:MAG TPA: GNAT family N-acetyltransferase [Thermoleophilia bacterium]|nr:GNAT family N-acetyltransferase [Thermoleophilia bacterium]